MNRMISISDTGFNNTAPITIALQYDANGNVRERDTTYYALNADGSVVCLPKTSSGAKFCDTDGAIHPELVLQRCCPLPRQAANGVNPSQVRDACGRCYNNRHIPAVPLRNSGDIYGRPRGCKGFD
jgi:hypothetical protein